MPEIADLMDVNLEDLSPEQRQQLQDVVEQFQQKCLLSFKKNRSGAPYLKNEMPRVLLPGESDTTSQQEKEECMRVFQESADYMLSKHNKAFLGALQQMMVSVFGPGMEQAFSKASVQGGTVELGESSSQPPSSEPASAASSPKRWKSSFPASAAGRWKIASAISTACLRTTNSTITAEQHRSTCATAESVPAHVRRLSIRLNRRPAHFRPEDCSGDQLAAEELVRRWLS
jgi:hypothetical protein